MPSTLHPGPWSLKTIKIWMFYLFQGARSSPIFSAHSDSLLFLNQVAAFPLVSKMVIRESGIHNQLLQTHRCNPGGRNILYNQNNWKLKHSMSSFHEPINYDFHWFQLLHPAVLFETFDQKMSLALSDVISPRPTSLSVPYWGQEPLIFFKQLLHSRCKMETESAGHHFLWTSC